MRTSTLRHGRGWAALAGWVLVLLAGRPASLAADTAHPDDLQQARLYEKRGEWLEACRWYDEVLRKDRGHTESRLAYRRCLRRYYLVRRHRDLSYRQAMARLTPAQALDVYEQVLGTVSGAYVDHHQVGLSDLARQGIQEVRFALEEDVFLRAYLPEARGSAALRAFQARLASWPERRVTTRAEARDQVLAVVLAAKQSGLTYRPMLVTVLGMEFASGACNSLDEYTLFLTPGRLSAAQATLQGKLVAVGLDLVVSEQKLEVARVYPRGPAREAGVLKHDRVLRIDRQMVDSLSAESAMKRLRGEAGTVVELEFLRPGDMMPRTVRLERRPVVVPSVDYDLLREGEERIPIGWLRISHFQETTPQEVREAIAALRTPSEQDEGMRALILDLRGCPGGRFKSAVQVAELFLSQGVIVYTQSQFRDYNRPYRVEGVHPLLVPMVVLIDGETASAAEVVASALKDLGRARLVGQTTFGKGSIQCIIPLDRPPLDRMPGGVRITIARFSSPGHQPLDGRGVSPHVAVLSTNDQVMLMTARTVLLGLLRPSAPMPLPADGMPMGMGPMQ